MQFLDQIEQRWEKFFPCVQVGNWQGPNCLLICQQRFWPLVLWHGKDAWDAAVACFCFKLIFSTEHWNDCAPLLRHKSTPSALLLADPDPQAVFMGMVLELWPAWEVYLDWFPLCPVAHGMDCCLGYAPWQWDHTRQTHLLGKCKTRTLWFISPTEQATQLDSGWEGRLAPCFSIAITVLWKENGLRSQKKVQIPQLPLWYKSKTK